MSISNGPCKPWALTKDRFNHVSNINSSRPVDSASDRLIFLSSALLNSKAYLKIIANFLNAFFSIDLAPTA